MHAVIDPVNQFTVRVLQETMLAAMPWSWLRRAETLDGARPRPDDFNGKATADQLVERDARLAAQAEQCRVHAQFLTDNPDTMAQTIAADVAALMAEPEAAHVRMAA